MNKEEREKKPWKYSEGEKRKCGRHKWRIGSGGRGVICWMKTWKEWKRGNASPFDISAYTPFGISAYTPFNISAYKPFDISAYKPFGVSAYTPLDTSEQTENPHWRSNVIRLYCSCAWIVKHLTLFSRITNRYQYLLSSAIYHPLKSITFDLYKLSYYMLSTSFPHAASYL